MVAANKLDMVWAYYSPRKETAVVSNRGDLLGDVLEQA